MDSTGVLVVEPDPVRRGALVECLSANTDLRIVGSGPDLATALGSARPTSPIDVLLINVDQPGTEQPRFWATLHLMLSPMTRIAALTEGRDNRLLEMLLGVGVISMYPPEADPDQICQAVRSASKGRMDYDPALAERIRRLLMRPSKGGAFRLGDLTIRRSTRQFLRRGEVVSPTDRERKVLSLLGEAKSNRQIARGLHISMRTVSFHISNILRKLGLSSRVEAALAAQAIGNNDNSYGGARDL